MGRPAERLVDRLRRSRQPEQRQDFSYRGSKADRELQSRVLNLERELTELQRQMSGPLWSLISVMVALALAAVGGRFL